MKKMLYMTSGLRNTEVEVGRHRNHATLHCDYSASVNDGRPNKPGVLVNGKPKATK